jgi:hypothetical protein
MNELDLLIRSLTNISPDEGQIDRIEKLRDYAKVYAGAIVALTPPGRERSIAKTKLEESLMWGVKAIALEEDEG